MFIISSKTLLEKTLNIQSDNTGGTISYATFAELPLSGVQVGTQAFVEENQTFYVWNGAGWFVIPATNQAPTITGANAAYQLSSVGNTTVINFTVTDPDGFAIDTVDYEITTGNIGGNTSIAIDGHNVTVTPGTHYSDASVFSVMFSASDGIDTATTETEFSLFLLQPFMWWAGGYDSMVERIDFNNDTVLASIRGSITNTFSEAGATGNAGYGWYLGTYHSVTERITYANDLVNSLPTGVSYTSATRSGGAGNENYGWFTVGYEQGYGTHSKIERMDYSNDAASASTRGPKSSSRYGDGAVGNDNYGWWTGGVFQLPVVFYATVDRTAYANDTSTALVRGGLNYPRSGAKGTGNTDYGWIGGGNNPGSPTSPFSWVSRIEYANDGVSTSTRGPLTSGRANSGAVGDYNNYGYYNDGATTNLDRIDYAADTGTASSRNSMNLARSGTEGVVGYPG